MNFEDIEKFIEKARKQPQKTITTLIVFAIVAFALAYGTTLVSELAKRHSKLPTPDHEEQPINPQTHEKKPDKDEATNKSSIEKRIKGDHSSRTASEKVTNSMSGRYRLEALKIEPKDIFEELIHDDSDKDILTLKFISANKGKYELSSTTGTNTGDVNVEDNFLNALYKEKIVSFDGSNLVLQRHTEGSNGEISIGKGSLLQIQRLTFS